MARTCVVVNADRRREVRRRVCTRVVRPQVESCCVELRAWRGVALVRARWIDGPRRAGRRSALHTRDEKKRARGKSDGQEGKGLSRMHSSLLLHDHIKLQDRNLSNRRHYHVRLCKTVSAATRETGVIARHHPSLRLLLSDGLNIVITRRAYGRFSVNFISPFSIGFWSIPLRLISFHPILSYRISIHPIPFHPVPSHLTASDLVLIVPYLRHSSPSPITYSRTHTTRRP